jgi:predicted Fe-S protein YdhL (DUF1289 family)
MISPCKSICVLDTQGILCIGCFRTVDELTDWYKLPLSEQERIMEECKTREEQYNGKC